MAPRPKSTIIPASGSPALATSRSSIDEREQSISPQFFRADNGRSTVSENPSRPKLPPKAATVFHVSSSTPNLASVKIPERANTTGSPRQDEAKFFHASDVARQRPTLSSKKSSPSLKSPQRSPELRQRAKSIARPTSPLKIASSRLEQHSSPRPLQQVNSGILNLADRRQSIGSNISTLKLPSHIKSTSTDSNERPITHTNSSKNSFDGISTQAILPRQYTLSPEISATLSPRSTSLNSSITYPTSDTDKSGVERLQSPTDVQSPPLSFISPPLAQHQAQSPPTQSSPQRPLSELVSNARRERKVLDLEISNSSLLAINRTLERELRKQSNELRRFRRLSRTGRLSVLPIGTGSLRAVSGLSVLTTLSEDEAELDRDVNDVIDGLDELDLESGSDSSSELDDEATDLGSTTSSALSPSSRAARKRARDEKRLMLDLSQHQQLLLESQQLSQSIRRCVGWTEEMIAEGKRALDYRVAVGDVKLGGRILHHDDEGDTEHAGHRTTDFRASKQHDANGDAVELQQSFEVNTEKDEDSPSSAEFEPRPGITTVEPATDPENRSPSRRPPPPFPTLYGILDRKGPSQSRSLSPGRL